MAAQQELSPAAMKSLKIPCYRITSTLFKLWSTLYFKRHQPNYKQRENCGFTWEQWCRQDHFP